MPSLLNPDPDKRKNHQYAKYAANVHIFILSQIYSFSNSKLLNKFIFK